MVVEGILNALKTVIFALFSWLDLPNLSDYTSGFEDTLYLIVDMLYSSRSIINLFLPWDIVKFGFPIIIVVINFEHVYHFVMWIIKKIPMIGVK